MTAPSTYLAALSFPVEAGQEGRAGQARTRFEQCGKSGCQAPHQVEDTVIGSHKVKRSSCS
jgi:hypothetical protein